MTDDKERRSPIFGVTKLRNPYVSETNPQRDGVYVETIRRTGRLNPGTYYRLTDGNGKFWEIPAKTALLVEETTRVGYMGDVNGPGCDPDTR